MLAFNDPRKDTFWKKFLEKEKMLLTRVKSLLNDTILD